MSKLKKLRLAQNIKFNCFICDKVFKIGPSKICGREPLKNLKGFCLLKADHTPSKFLRLSSTNFTWSIPEYFALCITSTLLRRDYYRESTHCVT